MEKCIHKGITLKPGETLPNGKEEIPIKGLFKAGTIKNAIDQIEFKLERRLSDSAFVKERSIEQNRRNKRFLSQIIELLENEKEKKTVVAVLAPWPEDSTLSKEEGYIRRIKEMDSSVLSDCFCVYLYECPYYLVNDVIVDEIGENRLYIRYNTEFLEQRQFVLSIIDHCDFCYSHSVLRIIPATHPEQEEKWLRIFESRACHVLDIHGAVVEEALVVGDKNVSYLEKAEKEYFTNINIAISLTKKMEQHFNEKYDRNDIKYYRTPVISSDITNNDELPAKDDDIKVVYCGGCQTWQNIPLIVQTIKNNIDSATYCLYISTPEVFLKEWGDDLPKNVTVKRGAPEEIIKAYEKAHYGIIFRDDNVLNSVACPTKVMEYIQFGIVPIVKTRNIGDFADLGLKMVSYEDMFVPEYLREYYGKENYRLYINLKEEADQSLLCLRTLFDKRCGTK